MAITKKDLASPKDIIAYFVSKLNNWINVAGVDDLGSNQWKILTCNTKWAQKGFTIPDIGKIIDVDFNNYITVESETEILIENFELYPIKFVHGTDIQVNIENFTGENGLNPKLRLPVVYLREFTEMTRQSKWSNNLIRIEIPLTLYFLTKGNHDEWKTSEAYNEAIYPMKNLVDEFQKVLYKEKGNVGEWKEDTLNFHPKFGVRYVKKQAYDSKGVEVNYFDDNLTGVECAINLPLKIDFCNRCKDYVPPIPIESISLFVNENLFKVYTTSPANLAIRSSLNQYVGTLDPDNGLVLIADTTIQLKDTLGANIGSPQTFEAESTNEMTAPCGTVNIRKTGGELIEAKPVVSNGEEDAEVADSVITNDPTSPTYTQNVKATEGLILPPQKILINTVNEGLINSVGDIEINTNVTPDSVSVVGRVVSINVPTAVTPSGVYLQQPTPINRVSFDVNGVDEGGRVQSGWYDYTPPISPKVVAELDYSVSSYFFTLKNNISVKGVASNRRFVDVQGLQVFGTTDNVNMIMVDKLTGYGVYRLDTNVTGDDLEQTYNKASALSIVVDGNTYDEWFLMSLPEYLMILSNEGGGGYITDPVTSIAVQPAANAPYRTSSPLVAINTYSINRNGRAISIATTRARNLRYFLITKQTRNLITAP